MATNNLVLEKSQQLDDLDRKQPLLFLPASYLKQFPAPQKTTKRTATRTIHKEVHPYVAEYTQLEQDTLELILVDPSLPPQNKRYALVVHHGSTWVSVPRVWLRDLQATKGDWIDIYGDAKQPAKLFVKFRRK